MKFEDLIVGMQVRAIDNFYIMTAKKRKWVGTVYKICDDGTFIAKTESSIYTADKNRIYECLHPEHFEEAEPEYDFDKNKLEEAKEKAKKAKEELEKEMENILRFLEKWRKEEIEYRIKQYYSIEEEERQCSKFCIFLSLILFFGALIGRSLITCA